MIAWWRGEGDLADQLGTIPLTTNDASVGFDAGKVGLAIIEGNLVGNGSTVLDGLAQLTIEGWVTCVIDYMGGCRSSALVDYGWTAVEGGAGTGISFRITSHGDGYLSQQTSFSFFVGSAEMATTAWGTKGLPQPHPQTSHVAITYDSFKPETVIYIDGVSAQSEPKAMPIPAGSTTLLVGRDNQPPSNDAWEMIDELAIYRRALSATEIRAIFDAGPAGKCL